MIGSVAPRTGAWIETRLRSGRGEFVEVAPRSGAGFETRGDTLALLTAHLGWIRRTRSGCHYRLGKVFYDHGDRQKFRTVFRPEMLYRYARRRHPYLSGSYMPYIVVVLRSLVPPLNYALSDGLPQRTGDRNVGFPKILNRR